MWGWLKLLVVLEKHCTYCTALYFHVETVYCEESRSEIPDCIKTSKNFRLALSCPIACARPWGSGPVIIMMVMMMMMMMIVVDVVAIIIITATIIEYNVHPHSRQSRSRNLATSMKMNGCVKWSVEIIALFLCWWFTMGWFPFCGHFFSWRVSPGAWIF